MQTERGNFLLQALLALTLVFAFIPFFARRMALRDIGAQMYVTTHQVDVARNAARIFIRENANQLPYDRSIISGDNFSDMLEPYGLPLGFVPRTALGQDIVLIIDKTDTDVAGILRLRGGNLSPLQKAELARRIGFFAVYDADNPDGDIDVGIQLADMYSDVVRRNDKNPDLSGFLADLDMGGFRLDNVADMLARRATFETGDITTLTINGIESGRKERSNITEINTDKTVFQTGSGESALTLARGTLTVDALVGRTISKFGDTGNMIFTDAAVDTFDMVAGHTGFTGPEKWNIGGNVVTSRITFSVERLDVSSFINATRGQDVFIDSDSLSYSTSTGIDTDYIYTSNITLRDQTSDRLMRGGDGAAILDIRPGGTSLLPDVLLDTIDNDAFSIIANPSEDDEKMVKCKSIISGLDNTTYNRKSLAQYIACQYVFWQRLEHRINIKQCLVGGGSDCR